MSIHDSRIPEWVKVLMLKGEKGDKGDKGDNGDYIAQQYSSLNGKPSINGVTLSGNKTGNDLGLCDASDLSSLQSDVSGLQSDVSGLQSDVGTLQSDVSAIQSTDYIITRKKSISFALPTNTTGAAEVTPDAVTGYTPIAIGGVYTSGSGASYAQLYSMYLGNNGNAIATYRNTGTAERTLTAEFTIIYAREQS